MSSLSVDGELAVARVEALPAEEKKAAVEKIMTANEGLFPQKDKNRTMIWMTLLIGLFLLGLAALIGTVYLAHSDKDYAAIIALGTAIVSGVIGLFAKSPIG